MKAAEEMKREQKEVKLRMILQDYHRRNNYELQQAVNDILALDALPPAEGAKKVQWSGYGELGNISQKPLQPTAEGAEEILTNLETYYDFKFHWIERDRMIRAMHEFATLHAQKIADKMKEANQFILDIAKMLGIEIDGVGFDELSLSIDDFKEAADKMVEERLREELMTYDKFLSNTYWGISHITKREEAVNEYLKSRER